MNSLSINRMGVHTDTHDTGGNTSAFAGMTTARKLSAVWFHACVLLWFPEFWVLERTGVFTEMAHRSHLGHAWLTIWLTATGATEPSQEEDREYSAMHMLCMGTGATSKLEYITHE